MALQSIMRPQYQPVLTPAPIDALPFIHRPRRIEKRTNWRVPATNSYSDACSNGRLYAAHLAQYLAENPGTAGSNLLGHIAADIDFQDESDARGYWVGFFSYLEQLIAGAAADADVFDHVEQLQAREEQILRQLEAEEA